MSRRVGEISAAAAAKVLDVDRRTAVAWAKRAIAGQPAPVSRARRTPAGRYFLDEGEVAARAAGGPLDDDPSGKF